MKHFKLGLILIALAVMGNALQGAVPTSERNALIALYNATNGDSWTTKTNWKTGGVFSPSGTEHTWYGIVIPYPYDHVTGIDLSSNNLVGTLPASIGNLTMLTSLNVHTNTLSGTLPTELGNLVNLIVLHLYSNSFTGSLPSTLGNLTHLIRLYAHYNGLSGSIPTTLGTMASLQELYLYENAFTGALPTELGSLSALQALDVHSNQLSGALPASLGNLKSLRTLLLSGNTLSGAIPTEWGGITALEYLYLYNNQLSGTVPSSLSSLTHLISLRLNDNGLTGSIPSIFGGMTSLTTLDLSRNHFEDVIPTSLGSLTALQNLALFSNKLKGPIPTSLTALTNLSTSETAIGFNALYTSDSALITFLNTKDPDWAMTQTIAPTGVTATPLDNAVIMVSWLPIAYTSNTGGYQVWFSQTSGGPYSFVGQTADKTVTAMNVISLTPGQRYYFVVLTHTDVHAANPNIVESEYSTEATAVAWTLVNVHVTGTVLSGSSPLSGVVMTGLPGSIVTNASGVYDGLVPANWSGTVTPTLAGHTFVPASRTYANLTTNQTGQDYASSFVSYPDRQALTDLYNATSGASWTNSPGWKNAPLYADGFAMPGTEGTWFGVTVNSGSHRVTQIDLNTNNLSGTIPASLSALTNMQGLNLSHNALSGSIPASLGTLTSLLTLYLNNNLLTSSIPSALGSLTALQQLWLNNNQLTGTIPTTLGGLTSILSMSLAANLLTGSIPSELGGLTNVHNLYLNSNQLSGTIPTALSTLTHLNQLLLDNNLLTGTIPTSLGGLTQLQALSLQVNQLSGSLPAALGSLTNLTQLTLNSNKLVGSIPTTFTNLVNLAVGQTDFGFNGLYTSDAALIAFLSAKDPDWNETQTIAPSNVQATALNGAHILVSWTPIAYKGNTGGYKVNISQAAGGPYSYVGQTTDKWATALEVSALTPGVTYYFVVQTHTDAHASNANAIDSDNSAEVSATAWTQVSVLVTGTVTMNSAPVAGVVMSGLTGNPTTNASGVYTGTVVAGWSGTVTPTLAGYSFTPPSRTYTGITTDRTGQDYEAAYLIGAMRQILKDLYNTTNGDNWTVKTPGWKTPPLYTDGFSLPGTEETWHGVVQNGGGALGLNLNTNNLVGTLPDSLGNLTVLTSLNLHTNTLSGPIPGSLGNLTNLTVLHLYENAFTGSLPSTLGNLKKVFQLKAHSNQLSGSIPAALGSMTALQWLDLSGNAFTGPLPTELGNLSALQVLDAHSNQLSGDLPVSLGGLTNLTSLLLSGNSFSGSIPTAWGGMSVLQYLYLYNNQLSGTIPSSLGGLTHLIDLKLNDNGLTGSIPSTFGGLTILTTLNLSNNHLDGVIPTEMGSMAYLQNLALFSNKLQGPVPTSLTALTNLSTSETAIGFNALYTTDGTLRTFLNTKDPDWASTQTVAPTSVTATSLDGAVIMVSWIPIDFVSYTGGYKVYMSQTSGGPYNLVGQTLDKTVAAMNVTSLTPGQRYYFVVRTITDPHVLNTNAVESANSAEASAVAWTQVVHVTGTITVGGSPLPNVVMSGFTVPPVTNVSGVYTGTEASGWSGTVTPALAGYTFSPVSRTYTTITADQAGQDYAATSVSGTITVTSPNGGETWAAGSTHNITWTQTGLTGSVTIDLYKGGVYQKTLGTAAATAGTFPWTIALSEKSGGDYRVLVWQGGVSDNSNADFIVRKVKVDFNGDGEEDLLWRYQEPGMYEGTNCIWLMNQSGGFPLLGVAQQEAVPDGLMKAAAPGLSYRTPMDTGNPEILGPNKSSLSPIRIEDLPILSQRRTKISPMGIGRDRALRTQEMTLPSMPTMREREVVSAAGDGTIDIASLMVAQYLYAPGLWDVGWEIAGAGDFNGDGMADIFWRNYGDGGYGGTDCIWFMNGQAVIGYGYVHGVTDLNWRIDATGDFNGDGKADLLWRYYGAGDFLGFNCIWYMDGEEVIGYGYPLGVPDLDWKIVGTGDFNRDGNTDILWRNYGSGGQGGTNCIWYMNGEAVMGYEYPYTVLDLNWRIDGTGDFNKDGYADIVWRYYGSGGIQGANCVWYMQGREMIGVDYPPGVTDTKWRIGNR